MTLERRLGEHPLPPGTWVVAAGNRTQDRALVRALSSALINRVFLLHVRVDAREWLAWAQANGVHGDIIAFIAFMPEALMRTSTGPGTSRDSVKRPLASVWALWLPTSTWAPVSGLPPGPRMTPLSSRAACSRAVSIIPVTCPANGAGPCG